LLFTLVMNTKLDVSKKHISLIALVVAAIFISGCSVRRGVGLKDTASVQNTSAAGLTNQYSAKATTIMQTNCVSCHSTSNGAGGVSDILNFQHLVDTNLVIPGKPDQSTLYLEIANGIMPKAGALAANDKQAIRDWISAAPALPTATPTPAPTATPAATPVPTPTPIPATFQNVSAMILQSKCVGCHSGGGTGGYAFDTYASTLNAVNKATPEASPLYASTVNGGMPKNSTALNAAQLDLILRWIKGGALNN
jgi:mono/diheme cytochrome c family protein